MRALTFTLGVILSAYSAAGVLSETVWQGNDGVQSTLCPALLCDNASLVWRGRDLLAVGKVEDVQQATATFREVLQRDPQDPYRWADLGEAFLQAGQKEDARYCYQRVLALAPRTAALQLRVANFYFRVGQNQEALAVTARILGLIPDYDSRIFDDYTHYVHNSEEVLEFGLPGDSRAPKSWFEYLMRAGREDDARQTWNWIAERRYSDDVLAAEYLNFLIRLGHPETASSVWREYLGARAGDFGRTNLLFNGGFESEPSPSPFDWTVSRAAGFRAGRDCKAGWSGQCSLQIVFEGTQNVSSAVVSELAFVQPGSHRFTAHIRTEELTTDQGIRFRISDAEQPARLNEIFENFTGSNPWSEVSHDFIVPAATRLIRIELIREPSLKFDNKIQGLAWIDNLSLEPIPNYSPQ